MGKSALIGIIANPATRDTSHNGGWTRVLKSIIQESTGNSVDILTEKDSWEGYESYFISEGVNFREGKFNFFGGISEQVIERFNKFINLKSECIYCFNEPIDYMIPIEKRKELSMFAFDEIVEPLLLKTENRFKDKLIIGDSHSVSIYKPGYSIKRLDGKTLYGFLKAPENYILQEYDELITYFGNIDVRFHLARQKDPIKATQELVLEYIEFCWLSGAKPTCLLPIEDKSRKIPKTGLYKGEKYFGSRELRMEIVECFNEHLKSHFLDCLQWPAEWYGCDYDFEKHMESRQSVHLAPKYYMFNEKLPKC